MKLKLLVVLGLLSCSPLLAQRGHVNHLRVGIKAGFPNAVTPTVEYVTHLWDDRIAFTTDFMVLNLTVDDVGIKYTNFEIGGNVYFSKDGSGAYAGISYYNFDGDGTFSDVEFDDNTVGTGTGTISYNTFNFKVGYKTGRRFYVRTELGYGFGSIPQEILVTGEGGSTTIEEIPDIPGVSSSGLVFLNIGVGFAFL